MDILNKAVELAILYRGGEATRRITNQQTS